MCVASDPDLGGQVRTVNVKSSELRAWGSDFELHVEAAAKCAHVKHGWLDIHHAYCSRLCNSSAWCSVDGLLCL